MSIPRSTLDLRPALFVIYRYGDPGLRTVHDAFCSVFRYSSPISVHHRSWSSRRPGPGSSRRSTVTSCPVKSDWDSCMAEDSNSRTERRRESAYLHRSRTSGQLCRFQFVRCYSRTPATLRSQPDDTSSSPVIENTSGEARCEMKADKISFDPRRNDADLYYHQLKKLTSPPAESSSYFGSLWLRFKTMYKAYWYVLIPVHGMLSVGWYGLFYLLALQGFDAMPVLAKMGVPESVLSPLTKYGAGYLATAFVMYKIAGPLRYSTTLGITTLAINYLKKRNLIKPVPTSAQVRKFITEKSQSIRTKRRIKRTSLNSSKPLTLKQRIQLLFRRSKSRYTNLRNGSKNRQTLDP